MNDFGALFFTNGMLLTETQTYGIRIFCVRRKWILAKRWCMQYMDVAVVWTGTVAGHVGSNLDLGKSGKRRQRNPAADQFNQANHTTVQSEIGIQIYITSKGLASHFRFGKLG